MPPTSIDIDSTARPKSLFGRFLVVRVGDCQLTVENQVRGQIGVFVWRVVGVAESGVRNTGLVRMNQYFQKTSCATHGPSDQVKTWLKPQDLTSASALAGAGIFAGGVLVSGKNVILLTRGVTDVVRFDSEERILDVFQICQRIKDRQRLSCIARTPLVAVTVTISRRWKST